MFQTLRNTLQDPMLRTLSGVPLACFIMATLSALAGAPEFAILLVFFTAASMGVLVFVSMRTYERLSARHKDALLHNWMVQAADAEERAARAALLERDPRAAWRQASRDQGPVFNVDGTPMVPGYAGVDLNGNLYGMSDHASPVYNSSTDTFSVPGSAYSSPFDS